MHDTSISKLQNSQIDELCNFSRKTFKETFPNLYSEKALSLHFQKYYSDSFYANMMKERNIFVATKKSKIIGYAMFGTVNLPIQHNEMTSIELNRLYVDSAHHGNGLGYKMLSFLENFSKENNKTTIYLGVYENNLKAQKFYNKNDFEKVGEYRYYVEEHVDNEFILKKNLTKD